MIDRSDILVLLDAPTPREIFHANLLSLVDVQSSSLCSLEYC